MEIRMYYQMLRRGWWIIILTTLVALFFALLMAYVDTPMYRATARFIVSPNPDIMDSRDLIDSLDTLDRRSVVSTYAEFMQSDRIYQETINELALDITQLTDYEISAIVMPDANILELTVEGSNPETTTMLANAVGNRGMAYIRQLYQVYDISPLDPALIPVEPFSPQPIRDSALAIALGVVLGAALAILSEQLRVPLESLRQRRAIDPASSVYNRRYFERLLEAEIVRAREEEDIFSLCLIRLEGLTDFLDTLPPAILNRVLRQVANTARKGLKGTDIVGRWDRDVFGIILPSTPFQAAHNAMGRLRWSLSEPIQITAAGDVLDLNPLVGVARSQEDEPLTELMKRAEFELAEARHSAPAAPPPQPRKPETNSEKKKTNQ